MNGGHSLYHQIGGEASIDAVVELLYKKILSDNKLSTFFAKTSMKQLKNHQKKFLTFALGGPSQFKGDLKKAHSKARKNGLKEEHFNLVAKYLIESLKELSVPRHNIDEIVMIVSTTKNDILGIESEKKVDESPSIYESIGGESAIDAAVELLYKKILSDDKLSTFFAKTSMKQLKNHQKKFLTFALGGPSEYKGDLRKAHSRARKNGLKEEHFNLVAKYLIETLKELNVRQDKIDQVIAIALTTKKDVLGL